MENNLEESLQELIAHELIVKGDIAEYNWTSVEFINYPTPSYYKNLGEKVKKDLDKAIIISSNGYELKHTYIYNLEKSKQYIIEIKNKITDVDLIKTIDSQLEAIQSIIDTYTRDIELSPYYIDKRQSQKSISEFIKEEPENYIKIALDLSKSEVALLFFLMEKVSFLKIDEKITDIQFANFIEKNFNYIEHRKFQKKDKELDLKGINSELSKIKGTQHKVSNTKRKERLVENLKNIIEKIELYEF